MSVKPLGVGLSQHREEFGLEAMWDTENFSVSLLKRDTLSQTQPMADKSISKCPFLCTWYKTNKNHFDVVLRFSTMPLHHKISERGFVSVFFLLLKTHSRSWFE